MKQSLAPFAVVLGACGMIACASEEPPGESGAGGAGGTSSGAGLSSNGSSPSTGGSGNFCETQHHDLDQALETAFLESEQTGGGVALAVITETCGRWLGAAGEAREGQALTPSALLRVGSVTKTYVAASLVALAEQGALSLDDPIDEHVGGVPSGDVITVRMLLNHTSGIFSYTDDPTYMSWLLDHPNDAVTPSEMVSEATSHPPTFAPGAGWAYSNTGYIIAGMILEAVSGTQAGAALRADALTLAELNSTFFDGEEPLPGPLARGYGQLDADLTYALHPSVPWTAGSMVATVGDVADWGAALYGGHVLSPTALATMLEPVNTGLDGVHYGLGVLIYDAAMLGGLSDAVGHAGDIPGYHTDLIYLEEDGTVITVIVNSDEGDPATYMNAALLALYPDMG